VFELEAPVGLGVVVIAAVGNVTFNVPLLLLILLA